MIAAPIFICYCVGMGYRAVVRRATICACVVLVACGPPSIADDAGGPGTGTAPEPPECDVEAPTECPEPPPRYADVEPIFEQRCVVCHDSRPPEWPLTSYRHVADWNDEIRAEMLRCTMPPFTSDVEMSTAERERILTWILCGYPE